MSGYQGKAGSGASDRAAAIAGGTQYTEHPAGGAGEGVSGLRSSSVKQPSRGTVSSAEDCSPGDLTGRAGRPALWARDGAPST
ncbi:rCG60931, partial [Rattus norvegicus]